MSDSERLIARVTPLDHPPDLLAEAGETGFLWREERGGIAAHGTAVRVRLPGGIGDTESVEAVAAALDGIDVEGDAEVPGCGPLAIGALRFDPYAPGYLTIPRSIINVRDGRGWLTTISPAGDDASEDPTPDPQVGLREPSPDHFELISSMSHAEWQEIVSEAVAALRRGDLNKVVLARRVDITANRPFVVSEVLERLASLYPSCMVFSIDGFVGASPELLIRREGARIESHPLAGTVARSGDVHGDEALVAKLMSSPKARHEHQVVVDVLREALAPLCRELDVPETPSVLGLRNVSHLGTHITGRLHPDGRVPSSLELAALLHPTPAVGGMPGDAALDYLQKVEGFDRGYYAGPVGWVDARGDGAWAIGIRSADVSGASALIYAGNGIVSASDPREELAETQLKLQALLAALVRP